MIEQPYINQLINHESPSENNNLNKLLKENNKGFLKIATINIQTLSIEK